MILDTSTDIDLDRDTPDPCPLTNYNHPQTSDSRLWLFDDDSDLAYMDDIVADFDFDDYCDQHPDFNNALNGGI